MCLEDNSPQGCLFSCQFLLTSTVLLRQKRKDKICSSYSPSTLIQIFLKPQLFLSGLKNFQVHKQRIQIEFACPQASHGKRIHSSTQGYSAIKCVQSMRHKARDSDSKYADCFCCAAILVQCSVRDWTRICYVIGFSGLTRPHVLGFIEDLFVFFHSEERISKCPDSLSNSPDASGRKASPERKSCGWKNIQIREEGALFFLSSYCRTIEAVNREFTIWRLEVRGVKHDAVTISFEHISQ